MNYTEWLAVMFPLVFSPGPANIVAGISGARVGIRKSIPLFMGINIIYISYSLIIGFGIGAILTSVPQVLIIIKYFGAAFVCWLGIKLWMRSKQRDETVHLGLKEGLIIQSMNPKFPIILLTMFSTFLNTEHSPFSQVVILTFSIFTLNVFTQFSWALMGHWIGKSLNSEKTNEIQDRFFAVLMVLVGIWIAVR